MAPVLLDDAQQFIVSLVDAGRRLPEIEASIDGRKALDEDERAALWLLAWSRMTEGPHSSEREIAGVTE